MTHEPQATSRGANAASAARGRPGTPAPRRLADYDDDSLLARIRQGDKEAFEALVSRHTGRVLAAASRVLGDPVAGRRVAEEVFVDLWREKGSAGELRARLAASTLRRCRGEGALGPGARPAGALASLPVEDREILVMRYGLDLGHDQMAGLLGRPSETLRSRAFEALRSLRASGTVDIAPRPSAAGRQEP